MANKIQIEFYLSPRNAKKIKRIAGKFSNHEIAEDYDSPCFVTIDKNSIEDDFRRFTYFWNIIKGSKTSAILINGLIISKEKTRHVIDWINCYNNREFFPDKTDYCCISPGNKDLHGWGCKHLFSVMRHGRFGRHKGIQWYNVGPFDGTTQFIDKQDIKDKLKAEAESKGLGLCPMFSIQKAFEFVDNLPDSICPDEKDWTYKYSCDITGTGKVIGVMPKNDHLNNEFNGFIHRSL